MDLARHGGTGPAGGPDCELLVDQMAPTPWPSPSQPDRVARSTRWAPGQSCVLSRTAPLVRTRAAIERRSRSPSAGQRPTTRTSNPSASAPTTAGHREAQEAAARLGVRLVLPLGLCFLPAFVLLGLVPVVLAAGGAVLGG
ncbi:hypothetical protein [Georgenia sp. SUBG003]|uniref:hypothetical protein n=1 Tax=Georgenia sp. SUBG003 TaxID=1497974 RepID=UPI003AB4662D